MDFSARRNSAVDPLVLVEGSSSNELGGISAGLGSASSMIFRWRAWLNADGAASARMGGGGGGGAAAAATSRDGVTGTVSDTAHEAGGWEAT